VGLYLEISNKPVILWCFCCSSVFSVWFPYCLRSCPTECCESVIIRGMEFMVHHENENPTKYN